MTGQPWDAQGRLAPDDEAAMRALRNLGREYRAVVRAQKEQMPRSALWHARDAVLHARKLVHALENILSVPAAERVVWEPFLGTEPS